MVQNSASRFDELLVNYVFNDSLGRETFQGASPKHLLGQLWGNLVTGASGSAGYKVIRSESDVTRLKPR